MQRWQEPNLARAPFLNERPVRRLATTLWLFFVVVGAAGLWMSQTIRRETGTQVAELVRLNGETVSARERATVLEAELRRADLSAQNVRAEFLNRRIAERSFSWNRLLETLTQEMPRGVRLLRLSPGAFTRERGRATAETQTAAATRVALRITGEAEETEALLEFVDRLFQHPAFDHPNLSRETGKKDLKIQFELSVDYLPESAGVPATITAATASTAAAAVERAGAPVLVPSGAPPQAEASSSSESATGGRLPSPPPGAEGAGRGAAAASLSASPEAMPDGGSKPAAASDRRGSGSAGGSDPGDAGRAGVFSSRSVPGGAKGVGDGGVSQPGSGKNLPFGVLPTALKPYASSSGVRR